MHLMSINININLTSSYNTSHCSTSSLHKASAQDRGDENHIVIRYVVRSLLATLNAQEPPANENILVRPGVHSREPKAFTGKLGQLELFLALVNMFLRLNPGRFIDDSNKILWLSTLLHGVAHQWFYPHLNATIPPPWFTDYSLFADQLCIVFGDPDRVATAKREIEVLSQTTSVATYLTVSGRTPETRNLL
ncbi:hypothetical protein NDA13_003493 [Ustilago tritici]|nr:hypothetical protein NDA13_003493 [Ustilago tritici]